MRQFIYILTLTGVLLSLHPGVAARAATTSRVGGQITAIHPTQRVIVVHSSTAGLNYTVELSATTKVTMGGFPADYADMKIGDHLLVIGKPDTATPPRWLNPIAATSIRIDSPSFSGVISAIAVAPSGVTVVTIRGRRGHLLRIDAPKQATVFMVAAGVRQTGHAGDLVVGEHISVSGTRVGKFELSAKSIHVYPHSHTVGGVVVSQGPGTYHVNASDGSKYLIYTSAQTTYTLNGKRTTASVLKIGLHVRVRGYITLSHNQSGVQTLIASHVSITIHTHVVHHPKPTPTPAKGSKPGSFSFSGALVG